MQAVRTYMRTEVECKNIQCIKKHRVFVCQMKFVNYYTVH